MSEKELPHLHKRLRSATKHSGATKIDYSALSKEQIEMLRNFQQSMDRLVKSLQFPTLLNDIEKRNKRLSTLSTLPKGLYLPIKWNKGLVTSVIFPNQNISIFPVGKPIILNLKITKLFADLDLRKIEGLSLQNIVPIIEPIKALPIKPVCYSDRNDNIALVSKNDHDKPNRNPFGFALKESKPRRNSPRYPFGFDLGINEEE